MGGYFLRLIAAVGKFFANLEPVVHRTEPTSSSKRYAKELGDYILRNYIITCLSRSSMRKRQASNVYM
eukprot:576736-Heterocapsa_arctica.AAC.1